MRDYNVHVCYLKPFILDLQWLYFGNVCSVSRDSTERHVTLVTSERDSVPSKPIPQFPLIPVPTPEFMSVVTSEVPRVCAVGTDEPFYLVLVYPWFYGQEKVGDWNENSMFWTWVVHDRVDHFRTGGMSRFCVFAQRFFLSLILLIWFNLNYPSFPVLLFSGLITFLEYIPPSPL